MNLADTPMAWETNPQHHDERYTGNDLQDEDENYRHDHGNYGERDDHPEDNDKQQKLISESEIVYSVESYGAVVTPVSLTMILSSLAVVFINTDETVAAGEEAYARTYQVFELEEGNAAQNLGASIANTLIIVSVICVATFVIVLLYKYRCLKCFYLYMVVVTAMLLGYFTANMWIVAIEIYGWRIDKLSFAFVMYNYALVGTTALFSPRGIPRWVTQGYLIASSVCLAWQLSYFNEWMAWTLLVVLALYDLFAVLSPCGPLKALAKLISRPGAAALPGLLYEASLPEGIQKPKSKTKDNKKVRRDPDPRQHHYRDHEEEKQPEDGDITQNNFSASGRLDIVDDDTSPRRSAASNFESCRRLESLQTTNISVSLENETSITSSTMRKSKRAAQEHQSTSSREQECDHGTTRSCMTHSTSGTADQHDSPFSDQDLTEIPSHIEICNTGQLPLALAKMYRLNILDTTGVLRTRRFASRWKRYYSSEEIRQREWTRQQLRSEVTGIFPPRGGNIVKAEEQKYGAGTAYVVNNRSGEEVRKFVVTMDGKVLQVLRRDSNADSTNNQQDDGKQTNSIKLGIGDFVFYSVLVSKAAQYSYTTFVTCFLVVLSGLAATLVILAFKGKALPALPISIFLGVACFLSTKELVQPWIHELLRLNFYV
jgi:presenilin 1